VEKKIQQNRIYQSKSVVVITAAHVDLIFFGLRRNMPVAVVVRLPLL